MAEYLLSCYVACQLYEHLLRYLECRVIKAVQTDVYVNCMGYTTLLSNPHRKHNLCPLDGQVV